MLTDDDDRTCTYLQDSLRLLESPKVRIRNRARVVGLRVVEHHQQRRYARSYRDNPQQRLRRASAAAIGCGVAVGRHIRFEVKKKRNEREV